MFRNFTSSLSTKARSSRFSSRNVGLALGLSGTVYLSLHLRTLHLDDDNSYSRVDDPGRKEEKPGWPRIAEVVKSLYTPGKPKEIPAQPTDPLQGFKGGETSIVPENSSGISRFDIVQIASNHPSEDYASSHAFVLPDRTWSFFAVFDGHNGWSTSEWLHHNLILALMGSLADLFCKYHPLLDPTDTLVGEEPDPPSEEVDQTIKDTFKRLDDDLVHAPIERIFSSPSKYAAINLLREAHAGSCALLAFYDSETRLLKVAVTGDSRAVLGRPTKDESGKTVFEVHVLSADQNAHNGAEVERMNKLHPGEELFDKGRVMGWGISRSFGNAAYKWSLETQKRLAEEYLGNRPRPEFKTPPYFTAEPEITTTAIKPGDFLVMASDGLWDCLTNEEVVGLVGLRAIEGRKPQVEKPNIGVATGTSASVPIERDDLPATMKEDNTGMYPWWRAKKRFVSTDSNIAKHLARNALGGADSELTAALLSMIPPRSRSYRDDLTAVVVFFNED